MADSARSHEHDLADELGRELLLIVRARRRLLDHELTRRRALLALTVVLALAGLAFLAAGEPTVGVTAFVSATMSGTATMRDGRGPRA